MKCSICQKPLTKSADLGIGPVCAANLCKSCGVDVDCGAKYSVDQITDAFRTKDKAVIYEVYQGSLVNNLKNFTNLRSLFFPGLKVEEIPFGLKDFNDAQAKWNEQEDLEDEKAAGLFKELGVVSSLYEIMTPKDLYSQIKNKELARKLIGERDLIELFHRFKDFQNKGSRSALLEIKKTLEISPEEAIEKLEKEAKGLNEFADNLTKEGIDLNDFNNIKESTKKLNDAKYRERFVNALYNTITNSSVFNKENLLKIAEGGVDTSKEIGRISYDISKNIAGMVLKSGKFVAKESLMLTMDVVLYTGQNLVACGLGAALYLPSCMIYGEGKGHNKIMKMMNHLGTQKVFRITSHVHGEEKKKKLEIEKQQFKLKAKEERDRKNLLKKEERNQERQKALEIKNALKEKVRMDKAREKELNDQRKKEERITEINEYKIELKEKEEARLKKEEDKHFKSKSKGA